MSLGYERAKIGVDGAYVTTIDIQDDHVDYATDATGTEFTGGELAAKLPKLRESYPDKEFTVIGE